MQVHYWIQSLCNYNRNFTRGLKEANRSPQKVRRRGFSKLSNLKARRSTLAAPIRVLTVLALTGVLTALLGRPAHAENGLAVKAADTALMVSARNNSDGKGNQFLYYAFSFEEVLFQPGDVLEYDIYIDGASPVPRGGIDADLDNGPSLRDRLLTDQRGISAHPNIDLHPAVNHWYHRRIKLDALVGQRSTRWLVAFEGDAPGQYTQFIHSVVITHGDGSRAVLYDGGIPFDTEMEQRAGYSPFIAVQPVSQSQVRPGTPLDTLIQTTVESQYRQQAEKDINDKNGQLDGLRRTTKSQGEQMLDLEDQAEDLKRALAHTAIHPSRPLQSGFTLPTEYNLSAHVEIGNQGVALIRFNTQVGGEGYRLALSPRHLALIRLDAGRPVSHEGAGLQQALIAAISTGKSFAPGMVTIQRRRGRIDVLSGVRLLTSCYDAAYEGGSAAVSAVGTASCTHPRVQEMEPASFADDFARLPSNSGDWIYHSGHWEIQTVGTVLWGANPYALKMTDSPAAMAISGYPLWSDYRVETGFKGDAGTTAGVGACVQDENNYYLLRWTTGPSGALSLLRVTNGHPTVLAQHPGGFLPGVWYRLGLESCAGELRAEVDHHPVFQVEDDTFARGRIALCGEATGADQVYFDTVRVRQADGVRQDFTCPRPPFAARWEQQGEKALAGSPDWQNCALQAEVTGSRAPASLLLNYQNSQNYYSFTWSATGCRMAAVVDGQRRLLGQSSVGVAPGRQAAIRLGIDGGYIRATVDGQPVIEALDFSLPTGRAGYSPASAAGGTIHTFSAWPSETPESTAQVTREFTRIEHHKEMRGWSGPLSNWEAASFGNDTGYWLKVNLYGDTGIQLPLSPTDLQQGHFALLLNGDGSSFDSGYRLEYQADSQRVLLRLLRRGELAASGSLSHPEEEPPGIALEVERKGSYIYAGIGGEVLVRYRDPQPVDGFSSNRPQTAAANSGAQSRLGFVSYGGPAPDLASLSIENSTYSADTFHLAPVEWRPQGGTWENNSRWTCTPDWTWYGGKSTGYAVNWHKTPLWGDQCIDAYTAVMMTAVPDSKKQPNEEAWRDLDLAFCGDGSDVFSGYSLVLAGADGATRLYRKGKLVAQSRSFSFPEEKISHRLWFNTRVRKQGRAIHVDLAYYGEDAVLHQCPVLDYTDPEPLQGGYAGFWTYDNGMMLAKVALSAQQIGPEPLYLASEPWTTPPSTNGPYPEHNFDEFLKKFTGG